VNESNEAEICLDISDEGEDLEKDSQAQVHEKKKALSSPWIEKFRTFCKISSLPEAKTMLSSNMQSVNPIVLEKFLVHLCQSPSIIPQLQEVVAALASLFPKDNIKSLPSVVRHLLLQDYHKHCTVVGSTMQACNPMQVVIMLSQQLAKPGVKPEDLKWLVTWVSRVHDKVDGKHLIENKKLTDFFEAVGLKLQETVPIVQVKQEPVEKPSHPSNVPGAHPNKSIGVVRSQDRRGVEEAKKQEAPANPMKKLKTDEVVNNKDDDARQIAAKFKAKRSSLGLGQKQVLAHIKNLLGPELKIQAIDVAKFEMNHTQQAMIKFLPVAKAWLKKLSEQDTTLSSEHQSNVKVKTEPIPVTEPLSTESKRKSSETMSKKKDSVPKVDLMKLKLSPEDFTSSIKLESSLHNDQEPRDKEILNNDPNSSIQVPEIAIAIPDVVEEEEPECIDLDEEDKVYRYFCQECEGCVGSSICDHTTHPRVPLQFDISTHIAKTGHVAVSPITGFLSLAPITDLAYTHLHGADVRKQWKDLVLAGSYIPSQYQGVKRCKWTECNEIFEDAVEAFKHIRDIHLKPKQPKTTAPQHIKPQQVNLTSKRKALSAPTSEVPPRKVGKGV